MSNDTTIYKTKYLTIRYLIALSFIALLIILAYMLVQITLYKQASDSLVINLSGRQRMLSQKLTKEVLLLAQSQTPELREKYRELLRGTSANWSQVHTGLQYGDEEIELPGNNSKVVQNLFAEIEPYYRIIKSSVDKILALTPIDSERLSINSPLIPDIVEASPLYLQWMNRTVFQYDKEAHMRVDLLKRFETYILITVLLILSLEALVIFRPMVNKVRNSYVGLQKSNTQLKQEIAERERLDRALQIVNNLLEQRVEERTAELRKSNEDLRQEISERKRAEEALRKLSSAVEQTADHVIITNKDGIIEYVNPAFEKLTGYTKEEVIDKTPSILKSGEHDQKYYKELWETILSGSVFRNVSINKKKDGELYYDEKTITPLRDSQGNITHFVSTGKDITERKRVEEEIRILAKFPSENPNPVLRIAKDGTILYANKASSFLLNAWGCEIGQPLPNYWHQSIGNVLNSGLSKNLEFEIRDRIFAFMVAPVVEIDFVYLYGEDITERKRAQEEKEKIQAQLRHAQKMETIGTLAGGIAHDFNNILSPILGYTDMALDNIDPKSQVRAYLEHVIKAANRAKDLVQQILLFSRQVEQERKPLQIHLIIKEALKLLQASLPSTIEIRQNIDTKSGTVLADPTQIHQVLMNLCTNAYHAMGESGGVLEVNLDMAEVDKKYAKQHANLYEGKYVRLTVSDTGHGMDRATVERIFEPFFTTKGAGEGTGLGLSVVHGIMASHGGEITVYSELGKGTTFHVYLPPSDSEIEQEVEKKEPIPKGKERILLVDDEKEVAVMVKEMLERLGYDVIMRTSSIEALEAFQARPDKFDIVITDLTMPNMTGVELAKELMGIRNDIPIILMTGFSEAVTPERAKKMGICEYIMKPIVARDLGKIIRQVLDI